MKAPELKDRLEESEKLIQEMTVTWEDKLTKTEAVAQVTPHQFNLFCLKLNSQLVPFNRVGIRLTPSVSSTLGLIPRRFASDRSSRC